MPLTDIEIRNLFFGLKQARSLVQQLDHSADVFQASFDRHVAGEGSRAAFVLGSIRRDISLVLSMIGLPSEVLDQYPPQALGQLVEEWKPEHQKTIETAYKRGFNTVIIEEFNLGKAVTMLADMKAQFEQVGVHLARAGELCQASRGIDAAESEFVDPLLSALWLQLKSQHSTITALLDKSNASARTENNDVARLAGEAQIIIMRVANTNAGVCQMISLPTSYLEDMPQQERAFLIAWGDFRRSAAQSAFYQGMNADVYLTDGLTIAAEELTKNTADLQAAAELLEQAAALEVGPSAALPEAGTSGELPGAQA